MPGSDPAGSLALPVLDAFVPVLRSVTFDLNVHALDKEFERLAGPAAERPSGAGP